MYIWNALLSADMAYLYQARPLCGEHISQVPTSHDIESLDLLYSMIVSVHSFTIELYSDQS